MATSTNIAGSVGDIIVVLGNYAPAGTINITEGSLIQRDDYTELWSWVQDNLEVVTEESWMAEVEASGQCGSFSNGDGEFTFRTPKMEVPGDTELSLCMRTSSEKTNTASTASTIAAYKAVDELTDAVTDIANKYSRSTNLDANGWQLYQSGLAREWGKTTPGMREADIVFPVAMADVPYSVQTSIVDATGECTERVLITNITATGFHYKYNGAMPSEAYILWEATGRN